MDSSTASKRSDVFWTCDECQIKVHSEMPTFIQSFEDVDDDSAGSDTDKDPVIICASCYYTNHDQEPYHSQFAGHYCFCNVQIGRNVYRIRVEFKFPCTRRQWAAAVWEAVGGYPFVVEYGELGGINFRMVDDLHAALYAVPDQSGYCGDGYAMVSRCKDTCPCRKRKVKF